MLQQLNNQKQKKDEKKQNVAPALPKFVLVDFRDSCTGDSFFHNDPEKRGLFPIYPVKNSTCSVNRRTGGGFTEHSKTQLQLKLC